MDKSFIGSWSCTIRNVFCIRNLNRFIPVHCVMNKCISPGTSFITLNVNGWRFRCCGTVRNHSFICPIPPLYGVFGKSGIRSTLSAKTLVDSENTIHNIVTIPSNRFMFVSPPIEKRTTDWRCVLFVLFVCSYCPFVVTPYS